MKKAISIFFVVLLVVSLVACNEQKKDASQSGNGTTDTTDTTDTNDTNDTTDDTENDTSGDDDSQINPPDDDKPAEKIKANVFHQDHYYEFVWEETDSTNGVLTITEYMTATPDEMASIGLSGELTYRRDIFTYNVTYSKSGDGVYVAEGAIVSAASAVEGESAAAFIQMMKDSLSDSKQGNLIGRMLDGEVLTAKDDIENYLMRNDCTAKVTFSVKDGKMVVSEYETNYIVWGPLVPVKEVCYIQNDVVRTYEEHYNGELESVTSYDENGKIEKFDNLEDNTSNTVPHDKNGDKSPSNA